MVGNACASAHRNVPPRDAARRTSSLRNVRAAGIPGGSRAFSALKAPGTSRNVFGADCARLTDDVPGRRSMMRRAAAHGAEGTGYRRLFAKRKACLRAGLLLLLYCDAVIVAH
jgi:hypothetical protein